MGSLNSRLITLSSNQHFLKKFEHFPHYGYDPQTEKQPNHICFFCKKNSAIFFCWSCSIILDQIIWLHKKCFNDWHKEN